MISRLKIKLLQVQLVCCLISLFWGQPGLADLIPVAPPQEAALSVCWKGRQFIAFVEVKGIERVASCRGAVKRAHFLIRDHAVLSRQRHYMSVGQAVSHKFNCPPEKVFMDPDGKLPTEFENDLFHSCAIRVFKELSI